MSTPIQRPIFYDGQIINANDLGAGVDYARDQLARHERYFHSWGVVIGLDVTSVQKPGTSEFDVTVAAGMAIDGRGREMVLPSDYTLNPADFTASNAFDASAGADAWYPVYIQGISPPPVPQAALMGACAGADQPTRQTEDVQFSFGRPGIANNSDEPYDQPAPGDATDPPNSAKSWNILIGFVKWDAANSAFTAAQAINDKNISRRVAGVKAGRIEGNAGVLTMQSSVNPAMVKLVLQEPVPGASYALAFGTDDGHGGVKLPPLLQISDKGDLTIAGTFVSTTPLAAGTVSIQSGIASDGMTLPLPMGVTDDDVSKGKVLLHIQVTPIVPETAPAKAGPTAVLATVPLACYVDRNRRVRVRSRYILSPTSTTMSTADIAGTCQYTVIASAISGGPSS